MARLPELVEPTIIIKPAARQKLSLIPSDIQEFIVLDLQEWLVWSQNLASFTALADDNSSMVGGVTKDNTRVGDGSPTADTVAQGTRPGGDGALTTGGAGGVGVAQVEMVADDVGLRFEARFDWQALTDEQQDATGQIPYHQQRYPQIFPKYQRYTLDGLDAFNLMTAAHYHAWVLSDNLITSGVAQFNLGGRVRKVGIDFNEILYDRDILASLLDILTFTP